MLQSKSMQKNSKEHLKVKMKAFYMKRLKMSNELYIKYAVLFFPLSIFDGWKGNATFRQDTHHWLSYTQLHKMTSKTCKISWLKHIIYITNIKRLDSPISEILWGPWSWQRYRRQFSLACCLHPYALKRPSWIIRW